MSRRSDAEAGQAAHTIHQFFFIEGLGDVEVGALLQAPALIEWGVLAADENDGDVAALLHLLELAADLEAALLGQHNVEQHALRALTEDFFERLVAIDGGDHVEATLA